MTNLIFDYDGTIHESLCIYAPAFRLSYEYLVDRKLAAPREWTDREISRWLGISAKEMWSRFMPDLAEIEKEHCSKLIGEEMVRLTQAGRSILYPGALTTLMELKNVGYHLIFLSNCKHSYMKAHQEYWGLEQYFSGFYCTEDYGFAPKWQIFDEIKSKYSGDFIVIGDRYQDIEIGIKHNLSSIGCAYGYGGLEELEYASSKIDSFQKVAGALDSLVKDK